jgi:hypothetical protein
VAVHNGNSWKQTKVKDKLSPGQKLGKRYRERERIIGSSNRVLAGPRLLHLFLGQPISFPLLLEMYSYTNFGMQVPNILNNGCVHLCL